MSSAKDYITAILLLIMVAFFITIIVVITDYLLVKNSYKELGKSIDKIFDAASKVAIIALIISIFKSKNDSDNG